MNKNYIDIKITASTLIILTIIGGLISGCSAKRDMAAEEGLPDYVITHGSNAAREDAPYNSGKFTPVRTVDTYNPGVAGGEWGSNGIGETNIYFDFDDDRLRESDIARIDPLIKKLKEDPRNTVVIEGHCDSRGSREYNLALGQRRADVVRDHLVSKGVKDYQIDAISFGEERPACKGTGEACWAQNRRATVKLHIFNK